MNQVAHTPLFDQRALRTAFGTFATGVAVATARGAGGELVGLTINSFSSVSLEPPLVLWSQSRFAPSHPTFLSASHFAINVLAEDQVLLSEHFARFSADKFANVDFISGASGAPLLVGATSYFECARETEINGGDHMIFLGRVECFAHQPSRPLLFLRGSYCTVQE